MKSVAHLVDTTADLKAGQMAAGWVVQMAAPTVAQMAVLLGVLMAAKMVAYKVGK